MTLPIHELRRLVDDKRRIDRAFGGPARRDHGELAAFMVDYADEILAVLLAADTVVEYAYRPANDYGDIGVDVDRFLALAAALAGDPGAAT